MAQAGYLSPKAVFIDGMHIKANANTKKRVKVQIPAAFRHYAKELMEEVNADREAHGKEPFDDDDAPPAPTKKRRDNTPKKKEHTVKRSMTDPDSGLFVKGAHKRRFAYEAHTACDKHGFILETVVTPGNVHGSVAFDEVYDRVTAAFPEAEAIAADASCKTPHICKKVLEDGRVLSTAYKRPQTRKGGHEWWKDVYDEYYDCVLCPEYQLLTYRTTNREGYREYRSDPQICLSCPTRHLRTCSKDCVTAVQRLGPGYQLGEAEIAARNLKKLAIWLWREKLFPFICIPLCTPCARNPAYAQSVGRVSRQAEEGPLQAEGPLPSVPLRGGPPRPGSRIFSAPVRRAGGAAAPPLPPAGHTGPGRPPPAEKTAGPASPVSGDIG